MELALLVYLIGLIKPISTLLVLFTVALAVVTVMATIIVGMHNDEASIYKRPVKEYKLWRWTVPTIVALMVVNAVIPSEKTAYTMVGAYAVQRVSEDPAVARISGKVITLIETRLDDFITESVPKKQKKDE